MKLVFGSCSFGATDVIDQGGGHGLAARLFWQWMVDGILPFWLRMRVQKRTHLGLSKTKASLRMEDGTQKLRLRTALSVEYQVKAHDYSGMRVCQGKGIINAQGTRGERNRNGKED